MKTYACRGEYFNSIEIYCLEYNTRFVMRQCLEPIAYLIGYMYINCSVVTVHVTENIGSIHRSVTISWDNYC